MHVYKCIADFTNQIKQIFFYKIQLSPSLVYFMINSYIFALHGKNVARFTDLQFVIFLLSYDCKGQKNLEFSLYISRKEK